MGRFTGRRILVAGDVMLDRYWWGTVDRISPEAPVPVVRKQRATLAAGGAANTAANLVALGAAPILMGVAGRDEAGAQLRHTLETAGIDTTLLLEVRERPTTVKTRIVAHDQHVVRVDEEDTTAIAGPVMEEALSRLEPVLGGVDAVVISDYAKGFVTARLAEAVIGAARQAGKPVLVDPKGADHTRYRGASVVKPNRLELSILSRVPVRDHAETVAAARRLLPELGGAAILVTEGKEGLTLLEPGADEHHLPTFARQIYDVTGAGDTVIATLALAVAAGSTLPEAAWLANHAAGVVVGRVGTAAVTRQELEKALEGTVE